MLSLFEKTTSSAKSYFEKGPEVVFNLVPLLVGMKVGFNLGFKKNI